MEETTGKTMETVTEMAAKDVWTAEDYNQLVAALFRVNQATDKFAALAAKMEAAGEAKGPAALKLGIAYYILCRFDKAIEALGNATDNKERRFFQAMALKNLRQYAKADEEEDRFTLAHVM